MSEKTDRISGRAKQAAGDLTGDDELREEGKTEEGAADVKGKVGEVADKAKLKAEEAKKKAEGLVDDVKERLTKD